MNTYDQKSAQKRDQKNDQKNDQKIEKVKSDKQAKQRANHKLVCTLSELESALSSWEELAGLKDGKLDGHMNMSAGVPQKVESQHAIEMRNRTRALLEQLKAQIDQL